MTKKLVVALVVVLAFARPALAADLKYTMHIEAKAQADAPSDPISAMAGGMVSQIFPAGGLDQLVVAGEKGVRAETKQDFAGIKAGWISLIRPDGTQFVLDPVAKTYWKNPGIPAEAAGMLAQMNPKVTVGPGGTFETIDGLKCEHLVINMSMGIPGIDPSQLPPGMPTEITMKFDAWLSQDMKVSAAGAALGMGMLKQFGFDQMPEMKKLSGDGRMMIKGVMTMFGIELVMQAKDIKTETVAADLFEIPKDYKEVPPPGGGGF